MLYVGQLAVSVCGFVKLIAKKCYHALKACISLLSGVMAKIVKVLFSSSKTSFNILKSLVQMYLSILRRATLI